MKRRSAAPYAHEAREGLYSLSLSLSLSLYVNTNMDNLLFGNVCTPDIVHQ